MNFDSNTNFGQHQMGIYDFENLGFPGQPQFRNFSKLLMMSARVR
jgi:hypothetical protein